MKKGKKINGTQIISFKEVIHFHILFFIFSFISGKLSSTKYTFFTEEVKPFQLILLNFSFLVAVYQKQMPLFASSHKQKEDVFYFNESFFSPGVNLKSEIRLSNIFRARFSYIKSVKVICGSLQLFFSSCYRFVTGSCSWLPNAIITASNKSRCHNFQEGLFFFFFLAAALAFLPDPFLCFLSQWHYGWPGRVQCHSWPYCFPPFPHDSLFSTSISQQWQTTPETLDMQLLWQPRLQGQHEEPHAEALA